MSKFQKGQSGNPGGKHKTTIEILVDGEIRKVTLGDIARAHTVTAINRLVKILNDEKAPKPAQVSAATALLDRGWGKPKQVLELGGIDGEPIQTENRDYSGLTVDELRTLEAIRAKLPDTPTAH